MYLFKKSVLACLFLSGSLHAEEWTLETADDWANGVQTSEGATIADGSVAPTEKVAEITTTIHALDAKRSAEKLVIEQSAVWRNWNPVENIGPANLGDAPVMLTVGPGDYWMFGRFQDDSKRRTKKRRKKSIAQSETAFRPVPAKVDGFDMPLLTTPYKNQFTAPGGLQPGTGGYHAWQSRDMRVWVHHGPVTDGFARWTTSAEWVDGKAFFYYDYPNDQDPHVYVDDDLFDGKPGKNMGLAVRDPSHGSDAGFIRDLDGNMHVIIEDWSPISANKRSWDSPLAGHAVSPDGIRDFVFKEPAVDNRTNPTGKMSSYRHPHWVKEDPENFKSNIGEYEIHEPEQEAYGDWAAICIGGQYYLFGDYDPAGGHQMSVGWFTSPSIDEPFQWCGNIGNGHPDPDVAFAEGKFYLATQQRTDYVSPGPWVETVEARVGVDTDNDKVIDNWTDWSTVQESYGHVEGFAKQIAKTPAALDLSNLPAGYGFQIQLRLTDDTGNDSKPIIERLSLVFAE